MKKSLLLAWAFICIGAGAGPFVLQESVAQEAAAQERPPRLRLGQAAFQVRTPQTTASSEQAWRQRVRQQKRDFYRLREQKQKAAQHRLASAADHRKQRVKKLQQKNNTRSKFVRKTRNNKKKQAQKNLYLKTKSQAQNNKLALAKKQAQFSQRTQSFQNELDGLYETSLLGEPLRQPQSTQKPVRFKKKRIQIGAKKIQVEIAQSPQQQAQGLMHRRQLPPNQGMLFVYSKPRVLSFWMKNTFIPLSVAFFDAQKKLIHIQHMPVHKGKGVPPSYKSPQPAQYALEMQQGWFKKNNISIGSKLKI